jgi:hypothetical protein
MAPLLANTVVLLVLQGSFKAPFIFEENLILGLTSCKIFGRIQDGVHLELKYIPITPSLNEYLVFSLFSTPVSFCWTMPLKSLYAILLQKNKIIFDLGRER